MEDRLDIVIFGATGFTGMHCIPYMHTFSSYNGHNFTWGIAGRSKEKLQQVLAKMGAKINVDFLNVPVIICDVEDEDSMIRMTQSAKLVINCVGPFIVYGEKVVEACLKSGTHYIDVCGEPQFMEKIELTKNDIAKQKNVYVISACGLDSLPVDLGVAHLAEKFGELNSVVTYLELWIEGETSGPVFNRATWLSLIHNVASREELSKIRKELFRKKIPRLQPKLEQKNGPHRPDLFEGWAVPFPGADRAVVKRTQKYFYEVENKRPVQIDTFQIVRSTGTLIKVTIAERIIPMLSKFRCGRKLLLNHPGIFTFGFLNEDQPSEDVIDKSMFQIILCGEGWKNKRSENGVHFSGSCDKKIIARIKGRNPGYGSTCVCAIGAAIMVLSEKRKLPGNGQGGVYTPGAAFAKTSLMDILNKNGISFDVICEQDILTSKL